jgi:two-component system, OmpR family, response regulator VicR
VEKPSLTTGEIADYCGVNFRTVIRWIKRGHLKAYQLPGRGDNRVEIRGFVNFLRENNMPIPDDFRKYSMRVLIVDDDTSMAKNIQRVLHRAGFETEIALDGFQAGTLAESFTPSLMTLDLKMPGLSGLEVIRFARGKDNLKHIKIAVVSAMPQQDLDEALKAGADCVIEKPFNNDDLVDKVSELMGIRVSNQPSIAPI